MRPVHLNLLIRYATMFFFHNKSVSVDLSVSLVINQFQLTYPLEQHLALSLGPHRIYTPLIGSPGAPCKQQLASFSLGSQPRCLGRRPAGSGRTYVRVRPGRQQKQKARSDGHWTDAWDDPPPGPAEYIGLGSA